MKKVTMILAMILTLAFTISTYAADPIPYTVTDVVSDGTMHVALTPEDDSVRVRLKGVEWPERNHDQILRIEKGLIGKTVWISYETVNYKPETDGDGNILAYVDDSGVIINDLIIDQKLGWPALPGYTNTWETSHAD